MKAEIDGIDCSDGRDLEIWQPQKPEEVFLELELAIGKAGRRASDIFRLIVATPEAIKGQAGQNRKLIVVERYDWNKIKSNLEQLVAGCERATWEETFDCLRHRFEWENEGC